jgi:thiamine kinase-like enzyme
MGTLTIPAAPDAITPAWLTAALRESVLTGGAAVAAVQTEIVGEGVGFIGQLARVHLTYDRALPGAPASLIAKFPTLEPGGRAIGNLFRFYEREVRFYEEIGSDCGLRAPARYFSHADAAADEYILLIEDMARARLGNDLQGCTLDEAELVVRRVATFHARWWESPKLESLGWMPNVNDPVHQSAQQSYQQAWPVFLNLYGERLSSATRAAGEALQPKIIAVLDQLAAAPRTISHGDYRGDNMFFGPADGELTVCDWQISTKGRGAFDIAYFLSMSIHADARTREEQRLLRLWHDTLTANGVTGYTWEQALHDYRLAMLYCWVYVVISIGSLDPANPRGMALFDQIFARRQRAFEELDAAELIPR